MSETCVFRESLPTLEAIEQRRSVKHVVVGKALEPARPRGGDIPRNEVLFRNRFPG